jgi:hypothetical protein
MMNVLDMLKYRLAPPGAGTQPAMPSPQEMAALRQRQQAWEAQQQQQLSALPEAVRRNILTQPGYGEGQIMAPSPWYNPAFNEEPWRAPNSPERRESRLSHDRSQALGIPSIDPSDDPRFHALPEGDVWSSRPSDVSPFASPLNQLMQLGRRAPLSMY